MKHLILLSFLLITSCSQNWNTYDNIQRIRVIQIEVYNHYSIKLPEIAYTSDGWCARYRTGWTEFRISQEQLIDVISNASAQKYGYEITLAEKWNDMINKEKSK